MRSVGQAGSLGHSATPRHAALYGPEGDRPPKLRRKHSDVAKVDKEGQQGETEDGRVLAFDGIEENDARAFDAVDADGLKKASAFDLEIVIQGHVAEGTHPEARVGNVGPGCRAGLKDGYGGDEGVEAAPEGLEVGSGFGEVSWLAEVLASTDEDLVGADNDVARVGLSDRGRFGLSQRYGDVFGWDAGSFEGTFVNVGGNGLEGNVGLAEKSCAGGGRAG